MSHAAQDAGRLSTWNLVRGLLHDERSAYHHLLRPLRPNNKQLISPFKIMAVFYWILSLSVYNGGKNTAILRCWRFSLLPQILLLLVVNEFFFCFLPRVLVESLWIQSVAHAHTTYNTMRLPLRQKITCGSRVVPGWYVIFFGGFLLVRRTCEESTEPPFVL